MVKAPALSKPRASIKSRRRDENFVPRLFITLSVILVDAVMLYPIINVISISLSSYTGYLSHPIMLLPTDFSLAAYRQVFQYSLMLSGYAVTLFVTICGTVLGVLLITLVQNNLNMLGIPTCWQTFAVGLVLLLGAIMTSIQAKRQAKLGKV